jgi:predicted nucleotidyltransferase
MNNKCVGITAEYNPFHNGHLYHLEQSKLATGAQISVAAMSGNLVQRGHMAICSKWERAEAAVKCGIDLVVEIPTVFACNSAPVFASAAVEILENLGADWISFGSESGNIEELKEISRAMNEKETLIEKLVREKVKEGLSYPRARRDAVALILGDEKADLLDLPNNILAIEYLKRIQNAKPVTVKRQGPGYNELEPCEDMASASAIRSMVKSSKNVETLTPEPSTEMLKKALHPSEDKIFQIICAKVLTSSREELDRVFAGGEGLGNKLKNEIRKASAYDQLIQRLKSKRYTRTRIERFISHVLLDIGAPDLYPNYIRVLAFNKAGSRYLKEVKKKGICSLPIITNINKDAQNDVALMSAIEKDILAADIFNLASGRNLYDESDYVRMPRLIE